MAKLAFLGTGLIGAGLAQGALSRGDEVTVQNRTLDKARPLGELGARVAETPADAIRGVERVHLALSDDAAVDAVLQACAPELSNQIVIDHTTASPAGTAARAARLEQRGIAFLHCPVFMSPDMCKSARGIMLAAGQKSTFEQVLPALEKMTGSVEYFGERRDLAAAYKLFGNAMIFAITAGLADVFAMARTLGIEPSDAQSLFAKFNPAGTLIYRGQAMAAGDYRASFELVMARKDARLMLEAATGAELAVLPSIAARMDALLARGHDKDDLGVLAIDSVPKSGA
jgi:3-hydroxyisobutyrate dehydrogenase